VDGGPENKKHVKEFARRYGIKRVVVSTYYVPINRMIDRGNKPIVNTLAKITDSGKKP
jgi:hypothetical protein